MGRTAYSRRRTRLPKAGGPSGVSGAVKTYCVDDAPFEELVRRHAEELGAPDVEAVYEVAGDVTPDDFPLD